MPRLELTLVMISVAHAASSSYQPHGMNRPKFIPLQVKGAYCLEAFCRHHGIRHPAVEQLITHLLSITKADKLPAWEQAGQLLPLNGRGDPGPGDLDEAVPARVRADFHRLVHATVEIGLVDFHGASTYRPLECYEACKRLLKKYRVPTPTQITELQPRPFPFHLWRPALKLLLLKLTPLLIIGYYGQRYLTQGRLPPEGPVEFVAAVWLAAGLMLSLTFSMDWLLMRRFTWVPEPEGVHIQEHGSTVQVVPWNEISGLKLKPLGLILWSGKKVLRFSYLPQAEAERLLKEMEARMRESGNVG